jgi:hypothetical protein
MTTFRRLGIEPVCRFARFVRLATADETIRERLPGGAAVHVPASFVANAALWLSDRLRRLPRGVSVEPHEGRFGAEFDAFDDELEKPAGGVRSRRNAEDLNWRYREDPIRAYSALTARRRDSLCGFAVYSEIQSRTRLVELRAISEESRLALLYEVSRRTRESGKKAVDAYFVTSSPASLTALRAGFAQRELAQRVVVYPGREHERYRTSPTVWAFDSADTVA